MAKPRLKFGMQFSLHKPNHVFDVEPRRLREFAPQPGEKVLLRYLVQASAKPPAPYDQQQAPRSEIAAKKVFSSRAA